MNRKLVFLYIMMIIVGISLFIAVMNKQPAQQTDVEVQEHVIIKEVPSKTEIITLAIAKRDIPANSLLTEHDYLIKTAPVSVETNEKALFLLPADGIGGYGTRYAIAKDSYIPINKLTLPSDPEIVKMLLADGMYIYPIALAKTDNYLLNNLNQGDLVDVYVLYGANVRPNGDADLISPSVNFVNTRIKPIISARRVLKIDMADSALINGIEVRKEGSYLYIELSSSELKMVKGLESVAKVLVFPSDYPIEYIATEQAVNPLADSNEGVWPVSAAQIFDVGDFSRGTRNEQKINELRGY